MIIGSICHRNRHSGRRADRIVLRRIYGKVLSEKTL